MLFPSYATRRWARRFAAFTLVELLVSMVVLTILVLTVASMTNSATRVITLSDGSLDSDSRARVVLDRMGDDFARMVKRTDVAYLFVSNGASSTSGLNDSLTFYSETAGYPDPNASSSSAGNPASLGRNVSLVSYHVGTDAAGTGYHQLCRASRAMQWGDLAFKTVMDPTTHQPDLTIAADTTMPALDDSEYQVIGETVFRIEFAFLLKDTNGLAPRPTATLYVPSATNLKTDKIKISDVAAVIVGIAVLDDKSYGLVRPNQFDALLGVLPDYTQDDVTAGKDVLGVWGPIASRDPSRPNPSIDFQTTAGVPGSVASSVRVYQRYFYLQ